MICREHRMTVIYLLRASTYHAYAHIYFMSKYVSVSLRVNLDAGRTSDQRQSSVGKKVHINTIQIHKEVVTETLFPK